MIFLNSSAQNEGHNNINFPEMYNVPEGTYEHLEPVDGSFQRQAITVEPFWMSNEITNKEYREYVTYLKNHPDELMFWFDVCEARYKEGTDWMAHRSDYIKRFTYSEIICDAIDTTVWSEEPVDKSRAVFKNYFTDPAFDNFPVVGVPYRHTIFYCIWLSNMEIKLHEDQGIKLMPGDYRLPVEAEWEYTARLSVSLNKTEMPIQIKLLSGESYDLIIPLHESQCYQSQEEGLCNFGDNVSEWVNMNFSNNQCDKAMIRGGSWQTNPDISIREIIDAKSESSTVGFRIVRSHISEE